MKTKVMLSSLVAIIVLYGCMGPEQRLAEFENRMNGEVGLVVHKELQYLVDKKANNILVTETEGAIEYQYTYYDKCSVIYVIDKETRVVRSWKYASSKELCAKRKYGPW